MISTLLNETAEKKLFEYYDARESTLLLAFKRRRTAKAAAAAQGVVGLSFEES